MEFFEGLGRLLGAESVRNVTIIIGVVIALASVLAARSTAKKKQSADLLFNSRGDPLLQGGYLQVRDHHDSDTKNMRALASGDKRHTDEAKQIRYLLNHFESLSVGIQAGIYDESMLKMAWHGVVLEVHEKALPFIKANRERDKRDTIWQEFEWLAKRWKAAPLKLRS